MKKTLQYNEYGAPIQKNPKWCDLISWILNKIGNLFYRLNGGLEKVGNESRYDLICLFFWSEAYSWGDLQCYARVKGYKS